MLSTEAKFVTISAIFFSLAGVAEVILPRLYNNVREAASRTLFWTSNGLNELPEVRFEFPFILIDQSTMAFLRANHGVYSNPDTQAGRPEQRFLGNVVLLFVKY